MGTTSGKSVSKGGHEDTFGGRALMCATHVFDAGLLAANTKTDIRLPHLSDIVKIELITTTAPGGATNIRVGSSTDDDVFATDFPVPTSAGIAVVNEDNNQSDRVAASWTVQPDLSGGVQAPAAPAGGKERDRKLDIYYRASVARAAFRGKLRIWYLRP